MMQRDEWKFQRHAKDLARAAMLKREHHAARRAWWQEKHMDVMAEVRATGIDVSESVAAGYATSKGVFGPQVVVRADLQQKLTECYVKMQEHEQKIGVYDGWAQVLADQEVMLDLHHDDYLFFFGT